MNIWKQFSTVGVTKHWIFREVVESPSGEMFRSWTQPWAACSSCPCLSWGCGLEDQEVPPSLSSSAVLWYTKYQHTSVETSLSDLSICPVRRMGSVRDSLLYRHGVVTECLNVMCRSCPSTWTYGKLGARLCTHNIKKQMKISDLLFEILSVSSKICIHTCGHFCLCSRT